MRHPIVQKIVKAYEDYEEKQKSASKRKRGEEATMNDRLVPKRVLNLALMFLATAAVAAVLCALHGLYPDQSLCIAVVVLVYFVLFLFLLEYNRSRRRFSKNRETDYKKIWLGYLSVCLLAVLFSFLPEFVKPVIVFPMIMTAIGSRELGACGRHFLGCHPLPCARLYRTGAGALLPDDAVWPDSGGGCRGEACRFLALYRNILPFRCPSRHFLLSDLSGGEMELFWYGAAEGALMVVFLRLVYTGLVKIRDTEVPEVLADILDDDYPMVRELSGFQSRNTSTPDAYRGLRQIVRRS